MEPVADAEGSSEMRGLEGGDSAEEENWSSSSGYAALPDRHMRLLHIEPGEWNDDLRGKLTIVPLDSKTGIYYEALSYY